MSVPETEPAQTAEPAAAAAAAAPTKADTPGDSRLPWQGKARAADILCWPVSYTHLTLPTILLV